MEKNGREIQTRDVLAPGLAAAALLVVVLLPLPYARIPQAIELLSWSIITPLSLLIWFVFRLQLRGVAKNKVVAASIMYAAFLIVIAVLNAYLINAIWATI